MPEVREFLLQVDEQEAWKDTAVGILYDLRYDGDQPMQHEIVRTLVRLPKAVRRRTLRSCFFLAVGGGTNGFVLAQRRVRGSRWLVVLEQKLRKRDIASVIAHEIAHAWLKHDSMDPNLDGLAAEKAAAELAQQWGFKGCGADVDFCTRSQRRVREFNEQKRPGEDP